MSKRNTYITNLIIVAGFCLLCFITGVKWLLLPAGFIVAVSALSFGGAVFIAEKWMLIGKTIGTFNAKVLLTLTYFVAVVPTGLARQLSRRSKSGQRTNWKRPGTLKENDFMRPF